MPAWVRKRRIHVWSDPTPFPYTYIMKKAVISSHVKNTLSILIVYDQSVTSTYILLLKRSFWNLKLPRHSILIGMNKIKIKIKAGETSKVKAITRLKKICFGSEIPIKARVRLQKSQWICWSEKLNERSAPAPLEKGCLAVEVTDNPVHRESDAALSILQQVLWFHFTPVGFPIHCRSLLNT